MVAYGLYNIYRTFTGKSVKDILPDMPAKGNKGQEYGDTDLGRGK